MPLTMPIPEIVATWGRIIVPEYPRQDLGNAAAARYSASDSIALHIPKRCPYAARLGRSRSLQFLDPSISVGETERLEENGEPTDTTE